MPNSVPDTNLPTEKDKSTLTKAELADLLCEQVGLSKREAKDMVEAFFHEIRAALEEGDRRKSGFGDDSKTKAAAQKLIEETEEDEMLLVSCKEDSKLGMILVVGGKAVGIPEDNGNVQAFLGAGAKPAHVTKAMYQQIEKKLM